MLLACANAGNLVLAKTVARRDEIAIRLSLGASRSRVARQMITEALVLSLIAGSAALYLAATVPALLIRLSGKEIANHEHLAPDAVVFGFTLLMSIVACAVREPRSGAARHPRGRDWQRQGQGARRPAEPRPSLLAPGDADRALHSAPGGRRPSHPCDLACDVARSGIPRSPRSRRCRRAASQRARRRVARSPRSADDRRTAADGLQLPSADHRRQNGDRRPPSGQHRAESPAAAPTGLRELFRGARHSLPDRPAVCRSRQRARARGQPVGRAPAVAERRSDRQTSPQRCHGQASRVPRHRRRRGRRADDDADGTGAGDLPADARGERGARPRSLAGGVGTDQDARAGGCARSRHPAVVLWSTTCATR